jgi:hypothetical protein
LDFEDILLEKNEELLLDFSLFERINQVLCWRVQNAKTICVKCQRCHRIQRWEVKWYLFWFVCWFFFFMHLHCFRFKLATNHLCCWKCLFCVIF